MHPRECQHQSAFRRPIIWECNLHPGSSTVTVNSPKQLLAFCCAWRLFRRNACASWCVRLASAIAMGAWRGWTSLSWCNCGAARIPWCQHRNHLPKRPAASPQHWRQRLNGHQMDKCPRYAATPHSFINFIRCVIRLNWNKQTPPMKTQFWRPTWRHALLASAATLSEKRQSRWRSMVCEQHGWFWVMVSMVIAEYDILSLWVCFGTAKWSLLDLSSNTVCVF